MCIRIICTLVVPFSLCWRRWYISHIHHFADGIWNIYTTSQNDRFSESFLSETPPGTPRLWSIPWEVPKRASLTKLRRSREERRVSISGYFYVQETPSFSLLFPVSSLCHRRLVYIIYESWLLDVFRVYMTLKPRSLEVCSGYAPRLRLVAYALQTSSDLDSGVVHMRNTLRNHDFNITYICPSELIWSIDSIIL